MTTTTDAAGGGGSAKKATDSWCAADVVAALGDTYIHLAQDELALAVAGDGALLIRTAAGVLVHEPVRIHAASCSEAS
jgi:hypothetical protein